jgi:hypothetical protein
MSHVRLAPESLFGLQFQTALSPPGKHFDALLQLIQEQHSLCRSKVPSIIQLGRCVQENGLMTPSFKLKRPELKKRFAQDIAIMYSL